MISYLVLNYTKDKIPWKFMMKTQDEVRMEGKGAEGGGESIQDLCPMLLIYFLYTDFIKYL